MNIRGNLILSLTGGFLLGLPWSVSALHPVIFIAWLPLLQVEANVRPHPNPYTVFNYAFISFLTWNVIGTWWVAHQLGLGNPPGSYNIPG